MKATLITYSICLLIMCSCNSSPKSSSKFEKLIIKTVDVTGVDEKQVKKETISEVNSDYFECELSAQTDGGYHAQKDIITPQSHEIFKFVFFTIVDKDKKEIHFMTSTEFIGCL